MININDCWLYAGATTNRYGAICVGGKVYLAHRVMYENTISEIPKGLQIDHLCRVRTCINPKHLEAVTRKENILRGQAFSAINAFKTHCLNGHEYTPENTRRYRNGRICRACRREYWRLNHA